MQKIYPIIVIVLIALFAWQWFDSGSRINELDKREAETRAAIKQVRESEQKAVKRATALGQQLADLEGTINSITETNSKIEHHDNEALETTISIERGVRAATRIAKEYNDVFNELRISLQEVQTGSGCTDKVVEDPT